MVWAHGFHEALDRVKGLCQNHQAKYSVIYHISLTDRVHREHTARQKAGRKTTISSLGAANSRDQKSSGIPVLESLREMKFYNVLLLHAESIVITLHGRGLWLRGISVPKLPREIYQ